MNDDYVYRITYRLRTPTGWETRVDYTEGASSEGDATSTIRMRNAGRQIDIVSVQRLSKNDLP